MIFLTFLKFCKPAFRDHLSCVTILLLSLSLDTGLTVFIYNTYFQCIIWNVEQAEPVNIVDSRSIIQSISWNRDGSLFCMTCKDKTLKVVDPRLGECIAVCIKLFKFT